MERLTLKENNMQAIGSKVIVKRIKEKKNDDFIVNEEKKEKFAEGVVLSCGEEVSAIKKNNTVWYDKGRSSRIYLNGEDLDVMDKSCIFVVV